MPEEITALGSGLCYARSYIYLVEKTNTPLVCTYMAKGILAFHHPLNRFALGTDDDSPSRTAINESDLVIAIGVDRVEIEPSFWHREGVMGLRTWGCVRCGLETGISLNPRHEPSFLTGSARWAGHFRARWRALSWMAIAPSWC